MLLGQSGAGKSTLLRCVNLLVRPTSGRVVFEGPLREHRRRTGMVFQSHQLIGRLSALANVLTGRLGCHSTLRTMFPLPREDRMAALAALDRVGLLDRALDRVDTLSGGMQQRVGIARALAQDPRLILADEPVASLDPATATKVLALLHDICKTDGIAAVVSLHQIDLGLSFADRLIGVAHGRIMFDGPAGSLDEERYRALYDGARASHEGKPAAAPAATIRKLAMEEV